MKVEPLDLPGVKLLTVPVFPDERGAFTELWHAARYADIGISGFVQDNLSSSRRGVLRGLHFQVQRPQGKLLQVIRGRIWDVVADVRPESPHFGQHVAVELGAGEGRQLWVPPGYAHGFVVLEDAEVLYKCTDAWFPADSFGIAWDDPRLDIGWPIREVSLSPADARLPRLDEVPRERLPRWEPG